MASSTETVLEMTPKAMPDSKPAAGASPAPGRRRRGRPALMTSELVLERIRQLAADGGLYRVHRTHSNLYARARRQFGSWAEAVRAAGLDYGSALTLARRRSVETRRRLRRQHQRPAR